MLTRRQVLQGVATAAAGTMGFGGYAAAEPWGLTVTRYAPQLSKWPQGLDLKLAVIADLHACDPWMSVDRIRDIVQRTNALRPDAVLLLGDYVVGSRMGKLSRRVARHEWAGALADLEAPLGVHAVLGNHDYWDDREVQEARAGTPRVARALEAVGIPVYENDAVRLEKDGRPFWIAGLGDQWAFWPSPERYEAFVARGKVDYDGVDDLGKTLAAVTDEAPIILMAHEPDAFPDIPERVALTIAGHTHGGQIRLGSYAPVVPSRYGSRYVYGHVVEDGRHLVVSGGLGCSGVPLRFGSPPEIVMIELGGAATA